MNQPDLFTTELNLASETQPDTSGWTVATEAEHRAAIRAEREKQTTLYDTHPNQNLPAGNAPRRGA